MKSARQIGRSSEIVVEKMQSFLLAALAFAPAPRFWWHSDPTISRLLVQHPTEDRCAAADGMRVWRQCLKNGRVPDFELDDAPAWPPQPLADKIGATLTEVGLPRATLRHPSVVPSALAVVLRAAEQWAVEAAGPAPDDASPHDNFFDDTSAYGDEDWATDGNDADEGCRVVAQRNGR